MYDCIKISYKKIQKRKKREKNIRKNCNKSFYFKYIQKLKGVCAWCVLVLYMFVHGSEADYACVGNAVLILCCDASSHNQNSATEVVLFCHSR